MGQQQQPVEGQPPGLKSLKDPAFWETAWQRARGDSLFRKRRSLKETVDFWNKRSGSFKNNTTGEKGQQRAKRVLSWLEGQGVTLDGISVLDIGAGPGAFSLAFARRGCEVVALEPAEAMVTFLREEIARENFNNIRVVQKTWEDVDLDEEKWEGRFDLVFASMSPGINNRETLEKALRCAGKYCYISTFAGKRDNDTLAELWPLLFGEEMPPWPGDIIYMLNLLYVKGLELTFRVWEEKWSEEATGEETAANLLGMIRMYGRETSRLEDRVKAFVREKAHNGKFRQETLTRLGQILVKCCKGDFA